MPGTTPEELEKLKHADSAFHVENLLLRRWSPRAFADKDVSPDDLKSLFDAARWAASSSNEQPWRFLVGRRGEAAYQKIFDALVEPNQSWAKSAPVLVLSAAKRTFTQRGTPNYHALHDTGAATATLSLQATAGGLHAHSMAGFDHEKARREFEIPEDFDLGAVTAIGYLGDPNTLPEKYRQAEVAPRQRNSLEQFVFSAWNEAAKL